MEDDKIKFLFDSYQPELPSEFAFTETLKRKMEAVECVKQEMRQARRRNKAAVAVAAVAGFAIGALFTLLAFALGGWAKAHAIDIHGVAIDLRLLIWASAAIVTATTARNAYALAIARLHSPHS